MNSRDYWRKRETEAKKKYIREEKKYQKEINSIYESMADEIQSEIDSFYARYAEKEGISMAAAKRRVSKIDMAEYERKAKKYVAERNFSDIANEEMRLYNLTMKVNRLEMMKARMNLAMTKGYDELDKYMGEILSDRAYQEFKRLGGILGETVFYPERKAAAIVNASFHNANFSERIWGNKATLQSKLEQMLTTGLIQGRNPRDFASELKRIFGACNYEADRLMRTEMCRVQTEAQKQSFERNGFEEYIFLALGTACEICKDINEKRFKVRDMMPGENAPPMHPNCRCSTAVWEGEESDFAEVEGLIKIASPASSRSFKVSLNAIQDGKAGLDARRKNLLSRIPNTGDEIALPVNSISHKDLAYLSAYAHHEFALFRSKNEDVLIHGDNRTCDPSKELNDKLLSGKYILEAHTHVDGGPLKASREDRLTLKVLGQEESVVISILGEEKTFRSDQFSI